MALTDTVSFAMPEDLSFLDQLEDWLEAQIPNNLHDLPSKMFDTVEKLTNDICELIRIVKLYWFAKLLR